VLCGFALFFFADPERAVEGFRRVLRGGGVLGISTFTHDGSASMDRVWELLSGYVEVPPPADPERRFDDAFGLTRVLAGAGFVGIDVQVSPLEVVFDDVEAWWAWLRSMEFRESLERMDEETAGRFKASAAQVFAHQPGASAISFRMDALLTRCQRR